MWAYVLTLLPLIEETSLFAVAVFNDAEYVCHTVINDE